MDKNVIFEDKQDYLVFMSYLRDYLSPPKPFTIEELTLTDRPYLTKNFHKEIILLSFVLMTNHFHLLLKQKQEHTIEFFMRSLLTRYVKYFNKRHGRVGHLFQGVYKGILVDKDEYLWWLTRYIHRNPKELLSKGQNLEDYPYSSYSSYLKKQSLNWIETNEILGQVNNYKEFVEDDKKNIQAPDVLTELSLDGEN